MADTSSPSPWRLTPTQWAICFVAALGFAFDIYELLMLPLIVRPALLEIADAAPGSPEFNHWVGLLFYLPGICAGVFGLLGGYLTDLLGRRRVLVWSILIYAFSAGAAAFSTTPEMLLFFRCTTFIGVAVEFVAAVAWLAELFPDHKQREAVLGTTQAFSSIGGIMVTGAYWLAGHYGSQLPEIAGGHEAWRYTLISGLIPAIPLIVIRPFLPESPAWEAKKAAGELKRPSFGAVFAPRFRKTTLITTVMFACSYGAAFGAIQHLPRIVPGMEEVQGQDRPEQEKTIAEVQGAQEVGGALGRIALAVLAIYIVSRRKLMLLYVAPGLLVMPIVFGYFATNSLQWLTIGAFAIGFLTVGQFSFWGNYIPRLYPTHLRGTGESVAANIGGRMFGTGFAYITTTLANYTPGASPAIQLAYAACIVGTAAYVVNFALSFHLPEPGTDLME